jgi:hypothetical protein
MEAAMAHTEAVLGNGARLADFLSSSLMARVVPPGVVHEVLDAHGRNSQRLRALPAVAGVYYLMALSLDPEAAYEAVFAAVSPRLAWDAGAPEPAAVGKASISSLRPRIGCAPLAELVQRCCKPMADVAIHPSAFYRDLRLEAIDGSTFELADERYNDRTFVRPGGRQGPAGYPQARCAILASRATHVISAANLGPYRVAASGNCACSC